ncbi:unnamed protein product [Enterobius vermicularis]|uniref:DDE_Tnp_1_7 domain-containing protein n=1 Tax=Enterobius vermicularis TaxID=51028 RepID=A0A0N4USQ5_ENTVE|nr:unnamed protein product [Enterobius vermicularis]
MTLCTEIKKGRVKDNKYFRYKGRECRKKLGFYNGTFFQKTSSSLKDVFGMYSYWAKHQRLTYEDVASKMVCERRCKLSSHTLVGYIDCFKNFCTEHLRRHLLRIGGLGKVVEIDKTLLTRRKYNRGRVVEKKSCFEGIGERDAVILFPLIRQYVVKGPTTVSDQ